MTSDCTGFTNQHSTPLLLDSAWQEATELVSSIEGQLHFDGWRWPAYAVEAGELPMGL